MKQNKENKKQKAEAQANPNKQEKKKFNVKAWLIASCFSILSCLLGLTNLILHFVDK